MSDSSDNKAMSDSKADQYLKEWSNAEKVRAHGNMPGGHPFRYA